jgi:hypothetical protein
MRAAEPQPALVVVIAVDQFRADYLERFREFFAPDGLALLMDQGAAFTDCRYRHAVTKTACGHATILSGVHANLHGIIANDWIDRDTLQRVNCVDDDRVQLLGLEPPKNGVKMPGRDPLLGASPRRFLATTVGDTFKLARNGRPKVIAVSNKDRSAILLGGHFADAAYWMDKGRMVSSTYYMPELPAWVRTFNDADRVDGYFGRTWERLLPAAVYKRVQGPDDGPGEAPDFGLGRTFPRRIDGGAKTITPAFYSAFEVSPFKSEVLVAFARAVVENENLGRRGTTDFLCLSFSVNDSIGHNYGPDSHEVMDITLRTDRMLADFFRFLDGRIGLRNCTIVFTADHGTAPVPERVKLLNPHADAGRIDNVRILKTCEAALDRAFGPLGEGRHWLIVDSSWLLFTRGVLEQKKVAPAAAQVVVRDALRTLEFVRDAFTRAQLESGAVTGDFAEATRLSFNRERSGDVYYQPKPFWIERKIGTNHGTPYVYDTHVPLLWFGVGVPPGVHRERVGVDDIAPLAHLLGILAPPMSQGRVLF